MHAIESDSFRTRPRESESYMGLGTRDEDEHDDEGGRNWKMKNPIDTQL